MASFLRCMSSSSDDSIVDSEGYRACVEKNLYKWNIPKEKIYKTGRKFVKTEKKTFPLSAEDQTIGLLPEELLYRLEGHDASLHIGLVQLALGPLTRQGISGTSVVLCLQDNRHSTFEDSLLGKLQFSLCDGQVYFNCFPDLLVSLMDERVSNCLNLNIKTKGYNMLPGSLPIALEYRVVFKVMRSTRVVPRAFAGNSGGGGTVLSEKNYERSNVVFPQTVEWSEVKQA